MRERGRLAAANLLLVALLVVHALDHDLRQSAEVPGPAATAAAAGFLATLVAVVLAAAGARLAAPATALVGFGTAAGFAAVHLVPDWGPFSQPYADIPVDFVSWVLMLVPALVAAGVGLLGLRAERAVRHSARPDPT